MPLFTTLATIGAGLGVANQARKLFTKNRSGGGGNVQGQVGQLAEEQVGRRNMILERLAEQAQGDPTDSTTFQAGLGELRGQMTQQQAGDRAAAARAGATGSELQLAQRAARSQQYAQALPRILGLAGRQQQAAQSRLLSATGADLDRSQANYWRRRQQKSQKRSQILGALGQAAGAAASAYGYSQMGSSG